MVVSPDNTRHISIPLGNKRSPLVVEILEKIKLVFPVEINEFGHVFPFKSQMSYFHLKRHIPPTNSTDDINISPVETNSFLPADLCKMFKALPVRMEQINTSVKIVQSSIYTII